MSAQARAAARESLRRDAEPSGPNAIPIVLSYRLPNPCGSDADAARLSHADLDAMGLDDLRREASRVRFTIDWGDLSHQPWAKGWLEQRLRLCKLKLRQGGER